MSVCVHANQDTIYINHCYFVPGLPLPETTCNDLWNLEPTTNEQTANAILWNSLAPAGSKLASFKFELVLYAKWTILMPF